VAVDLLLEHVDQLRDSVLRASGTKRGDQS
jgi:hypothetical protein